MKGKLVYTAYYLKVKGTGSILEKAMLALPENRANWLVPFFEHEMHGRTDEMEINLIMSVTPDSEIQKDNEGNFTIFIQ